MKMDKQTWTQEKADRYSANTNGKQLTCGNCQHPIEVGQSYVWSGRTMGNAYSHAACQGPTLAKRLNRRAKNWEHDELR